MEAVVVDVEVSKPARPLRCRREFAGEAAAAHTRPEINVLDVRRQLEHVIVEARDGHPAVLIVGEYLAAGLPVVSNRKYMGLATEHRLIELTDRSQALKELELEYQDVHVLQRQHFYDVMEVAIKNKIQVVPVLDEEQDLFPLMRRRCPPGTRSAPPGRTLPARARSPASVCSM